MVLASEKGWRNLSFPQQNQYRGCSKAAARGWGSSTLLWWLCLCGLVGQDNK